jgi:hypothetical protein
VIEIKRNLIKSKCACKGSQLYLEMNFSIMAHHLQVFLTNGFETIKSYGAQGLFYIEDKNMFAIAPYGSNRLQIRCKNDSCENSLDSIEKVFRQ